MPVFHRFYRAQGTSPQWAELYAGANLEYAEHISVELIPGDVISDSIAFTGIYEPALTARIVEDARRHGGLFVDVGANLGYYSLLWASAARRNTCIAFEPSRRVRELLRRNVQRNKLDERIQVIPMAAGSTRGLLPFDSGPEGQLGWGGFSPSATDGAELVEVVRVDDMVPSDASVDVLKIDVEGADTWVLMGCDRLLSERRVARVYYEQNKPRMHALGVSFEAAQSYLAAVGYACTPMGNAEAEVVLWTAQPSK